MDDPKKKDKRVTSKRFVNPKPNGFRRDNTMVNDRFIQDMYKPYQEDMGWESGHATFPTQAEVREDTRSGVRKGVDRVKGAYRKNVPESFKMFMPGVADIEDARYVNEQWGPEGTVGGKALSAGLMALPFVGSKALKRPIKSVFNKGINKRVLESMHPKNAQRIKSAFGEFTDKEIRMLKPVDLQKDLAKVPKKVYRTVFNPETVTASFADDVIKKVDKPITSTRIARNKALELSPDVYTHGSGMNVGMSTLMNKSDALNVYGKKAYKGSEYYNWQADKLNAFNDATTWIEHFKPKSGSKILGADAYYDFHEAANKLGWNQKQKANFLQKSGYDAVKKWSNSPEVQFLNPKKSLSLKKLKRIPPTDVGVHKYGGKLQSEYQKGGDMNNLLDAYDRDYIEQYGLGGWLKENAGNLLTTAGGTALTALGMPGAGIPMMAGGIGGMVAGGGEQTVDEPRETPYDDYGLRTVDQPMSTSNVRPMAMGGELTEYEGPTHGQGGIKLGGIGAEVEGGEARTGDIVHSDKVLITQDILREFGKGYGGDVPITENDIGKSIADIIKSKENKFKKYEGDKWNEMSRKAAHLPFEKMSTILAEREEIDSQMAETSAMMAYGGALIRKRDGMGPEGEGPLTGRGLGPCNEENDILQEGGPLLDEPEKMLTDNWLTTDNKMPVTELTMQKEWTDRGMEFSNDPTEFNDRLEVAYPGQTHMPYGMDDGKYYKNFPQSVQIGEGGEKTGSWRPFLNSQTGQPIDYDKKQGGGLLETKGLNTSIDTNTLATMPTYNEKSGNFGKLFRGIGSKFGNEEGQFGMNDLMGIAPIIGSAIGYGSTKNREPEKVEYQRARYTPVKPALMDSTQQVEGVRSAFDTANLQMRQTSPKDFLRRRTASATQEAGAVAGVRGGVQQANVGISNRADEINARNRLYAEQMNTQVGMREQDANAANRAMLESTKDMYRNQIFTQAGQYARDVKLGKANEAYNKRYLDIIEGEKDAIGGNVGDMGIGNTNTEQPPFNSAEDYSTDIAGEGFQTGIGMDRQQGWFPGMNNNFNSNQNMMNPYGRFGSSNYSRRIMRFNPRQRERKSYE